MERNSRSRRECRVCRVSIAGSGPFASACRQMVLGPVMNSFVLGGGQPCDAGLQTPGELCVARKEIERSGFDGPCAAHPPGGSERFGILDFAAELAFQENHQEMLVKPILGPLFGLHQSAF